MDRIRNINDVLAGLFLIAVAMIALGLMWNLRSGSAASMGPGYLPKLLAVIQLIFGVVIVAQGLLGTLDRLEPWRLRPLIWILAGVAFFGLAIERFGLVVAVSGLVLLSALGHRGTRPLEAILLAAVLATFSVLVFVKVLGLPMPIWPPGLVR
jgi:putative tricarboxylic transport membrane protein